MPRSNYRPARPGGALLLLLGLSLLGGAAGCASGRPRWLPWGPPGPITIQQQRAVVQDPYPTTDEGPEVVGGRPRDYQKPLAEPVRGRLIRDQLWGR